MRIIEYDSGTLKELDSESHAYETEIDKSLHKIGTIIGNEYFSGFAPLVFLVKKENLGPWEEEREKIKSKVQIYFKNIDPDDLLNYASGIYRVKTDSGLKKGSHYNGFAVDDGRMKSVPAIVAVADKGAMIHETEHFIKKIFYDTPSGDAGGVAGFMSGPLDAYSLFNIEFLPHLLEDGNVERYIKNAGIYPFAHPPMDDDYASRLRDFADNAAAFIRTHEDGLLALITCYPMYRQTASDSKGPVWAKFDVPDNPAEDMMCFETQLIRWGYDLKKGITEESSIWPFLKEKFKDRSEQWFTIYQTQMNPESLS